MPAPSRPHAVSERSPARRRARLALVVSAFALTILAAPSAHAESRPLIVRSPLDLFVDRPLLTGVCGFEVRLHI
jgi:hypothetical protein